MWLYFDKNGAIKEVLEHGSPARTGSTNFEIFAYFEDVNILTDYNNAKLSLIKPNQAYAEKNSVYDGLSMKIKTKTFVSRQSDSNAAFFRPNQHYTGYYFDFNQVTMTYDEFSDLLVLLDTPGVWSAIITLFSANGNINVQGRAEFNVQDTGYEEEETILPEGYTIEQIYQALAQKLNIKSDAYVKVVDNHEMDYDSDIFNENDIIFSRDDMSFYKLIYGINEDNEEILVPEFIFDLDKIKFCTQAEYDEMEEAGTLLPDTLYIITDDDTYQELLEAIEDIKNTTIAGLDLNDNISSQELTDNLVLATDADIDALF